MLGAVPGSAGRPGGVESVWRTPNRSRSSGIEADAAEGKRIDMSVPLVSSQVRRVTDLGSSPTRPTMCCPCRNVLSRVNVRPPPAAGAFVVRRGRHPARSRERLPRTRDGRMCEGLCGWALPCGSAWGWRLSVRGPCFVAVRDSGGRGLLTRGPRAESGGGAYIPCPPARVRTTLLAVQLGAAGRDYPRTRGDRPRCSAGEIRSRGRRAWCVSA